ncbi:hypothetical protein, partial [Streptomyces lonegramiae]
MSAKDGDDTDTTRPGLSHWLPLLSGAAGSAVRPVARTVGYYAKTWHQYLNHEPHELPIARPTLALAAHALRDEIVLLGLRARRPVGDVSSFERINAEIVEALDFYGHKGWLNNPARF